MGFKPDPIRESQLPGSASKDANADPISEKVIKGSFWVLALRLTSRILGILRTFVLARLLLPEDFGLIGVAAVTISFIETFSQPGLGAALVQKNAKVEKYLDTVWTLSLIRSVFIYGLLFMIAPWVSNFFKAPEAAGILRVFGISVIIAGCRNSGVILFHKTLNFRKQYIYELSILLGNIGVALPAAMILNNVWALVLGGLAASVTRCVMSYILHPFRPRFRFEIEKFLEMFRFGKWVLGSSIVLFCITQGDDIFIGRTFGVTVLGVYQMAYMVSNLPTTELSRVISHVTFPAYSQLQGNVYRLSNAYLKVLQMVAFISFPLAGVLYVFASDGVGILLSDRWQQVVPILKVLIWSGLVQTVIDTTSAVFNACGKPSLNTKWQLINLVTLFSLLYPLSRVFDVTGVVIAVLIATIAAALFAIHEARKILQISIFSFMKVLFFPIFGMLTSVIAVQQLRSVLEIGENLKLILLLIIGSIIYSSLAYFYDLKFNYNIRAMIKEAVKSFRINHTQPGKAGNEY